MPSPRAGWVSDALTDLNDGPAAFAEILALVDGSIGAVACTSSTRPTGYDGMLAYETDTESLIRFKTGTGWQRMFSLRRTYTPTVTGVTTSAVAGRWTRTGDTVHYEFDITVSAAPTGSVTVTLPIGTIGYGTTAQRQIGFGTIKDVSGGVYYPTFGLVQDLTTSYSVVTLWAPTASGNIQYALLGATAPIPWASGDTISMQGSYPA